MPDWVREGINPSPTLEPLTPGPRERLLSLVIFVLTAGGSSPLFHPFL